MAPSLHAKSRPSSLLSRHSSRKSSAISHSSQGDFVYRHGAKLHCYSREVAPHPFSYERKYLELNLLDRALVDRTKKGVTFMDYSTSHPSRCLDLGCGLGTWTIDAAKQWPDATFVGFDLVDVQIKLDYLEPSMAERIQWVHGNFLERLPFEDNEFDHIHLFTLALSVPEDRWPSLYDELVRVLKPGGHVEQIDEDAIFPVLPRWFTQPLHNAVKRGSHKNNADPVASHKYYETPADLPHDHALLETLFYSVFERRFINPKPSSIIPGYFSAVFNHVVSPPILYFPMPPLAPLPPFPRETTFPSRPAPPAMHLDTTGLGYPSTAPSPLSASSTLVNPSFSAAPDASPRTLTGPSAAHHPALPGLERIASIATTASAGSDESIHSATSSSGGSGASGALVLPALAEMGETVQLGGREAYGLFAMDVLAELDEHNLYMHLYRATSLVWAVKEAMWDELRALLARGPAALARYGWEDGEYAEEPARERFDAMYERYRADIHARIALWHPMMQYGWTYPRQDPMTETELADQEQLRIAIMEARAYAKEEEIQPTLRVIRLLVGTKGN